MEDSTIAIYTLRDELEDSIDLYNEWAAGQRHMDSCVEDPAEIQAIREEQERHAARFQDDPTDIWVGPRVS